MGNEIFNENLGNQSADLQYDNYIEYEEREKLKFLKTEKFLINEKPLALYLEFLGKPAFHINDEAYKIMVENFTKKYNSKSSEVQTLYLGDKIVAGLGIENKKHSLGKYKIDDYYLKKYLKYKKKYLELKNNYKSK